MTKKARVMFELAQRVLTNGVDARDENGATELHALAADKSAGVAELSFLVGSGFDFDAQDKGGMTPLMIAAESRNDDAVRFLVDVGANDKLKNAKGEEASLIAGRNRVLEDALSYRSSYHKNELMTVSRIGQADSDGFPSALLFDERGLAVWLSAGGSSNDGPAAAKRTVDIISASRPGDVVLVTRRYGTVKMNLTAEGDFSALWNGAVPSAATIGEAPVLASKKRAPGAAR